MSENVNDVPDVQKEIERAKQELEKANQNGSAREKKLSGEELLAKMFVPRESKEEFRPLPKGPGQKDLIITAYYHEILVNGQDGKPAWKKVYCPAFNEPQEPKLDSEGNPVKDQNGKTVMKRKYCPICKKYHDILKDVDNSVDLRKIKSEDLTPEQKKIAEKNKDLFKKAGQYKPRKFYIIRGIDKGKIKDGVKFWRFKDNYKKQGTYDKLMPVLKDFMEDKQALYYDPENGCDLSITTAKVLNQANNKEYTSVSAITCKQKPLTDDPVLKKQWLNDPITFKDVYGPRVSFPVIDYNKYLELVAEGNSPYWNSDGKRFVFPNHPEIEEEVNRRRESFLADNDNTETKSVSTSATDIDDVVNKLENKAEKAASETSADTSESKTSVDTSEPETSVVDDIDSELNDLPF